MKHKPKERQPSELKFLETRRYCRNEIAVIFRISPRLIQANGMPKPSLRKVSKMMSSKDRFDLLRALDEAIQMMQCLVDSNYMPPRFLTPGERQERQSKLDLIKRYKTMQRQLRFWRKADGSRRKAGR